MLKTVCTVMLILFLALSPSFFTTAAAQSVNDGAIPAGTCPKGFAPMDVMEHDEMEHTHAGLKVDLNGNGTICMFEATTSIHVHADDVVR
jgi:hypothetical protein